MEVGLRNSGLKGICAPAWQLSWYKLLHKYAAPNGSIMKLLCCFPENPGHCMSPDVPIDSQGLSHVGLTTEGVYFDFLEF